MINVIIAEDDLNQAKIFNDFLTKAGLNVVALTTTGEKTIDEYLNKKPDVLFLDLDMPNINGMGVLKFLKLNSNKKNIVVTSQSNTLMSNLYDFSNIYWLMPKPFSYSKAIEVAQEISNSHNSIYIKNIIKDILIKLNFNLSSYGTSNFTELIFLKYQRSSQKIPMKQLYSIIASKTGFNSSINIKWSIENSLSSAKKHINEEILYSIFNNYNKFFPLTQSYLAELIIDYINLKENNQ